ncbi:hypothetical protein NKG94_23240 [Micromonospora sp. M12]
MTVYTGTVEGRDTPSVAADTRTVVASALAPFPVTTTARASTVLRALPPALADGTTVRPGVPVGAGRPAAEASWSPGAGHSTPATRCC